MKQKGRKTKPKKAFKFTCVHGIRASSKLRELHGRCTPGDVYVHPHRKPLPAYEVHQTLEQLSNELVRRANGMPGQDFRVRNLWLSIAKEVRKLEPATLVDYPII